MQNNFIRIGLLLLCAMLANVGAAELKLAGLFTDHAVLQREAPVPIWGWAETGSLVRVEFAGQTKSTRTDANGKWLVRLDAMLGETTPRELIVRTAGQTLHRSDILVGDVWLCSGQSNMGIPLNIAENAYLQERIAAANNSHLRLFATLHQFPDVPARDTIGRWDVATSDSVKNWIAIGYLFGDRIQRAVGVPIGILVSCMGGTCIESWLPRDVLLANPAHAAYLTNHANAVQQLPQAMQRYEQELAAFHKQGRPGQREPRSPDGQPNSARNPAACFNGKIVPLLPFALKGVLWYQGEGNDWGFADYPSQMADLLRVWRASFEQPRLPFIMTELAPLGPPESEPHDSARARFGEALARTAKADGNAWVITIVDGGEPQNIHPIKKEIPADRFAAMALVKIYGQAGLAHGPVLKTWKVSQGAAELTFGSVGSGLIVKELSLGGQFVAADKLQGFELAGANQIFFRAEARLKDKDTVMVMSPHVLVPVAVRYAWAAFPICNLFNAEGFAAYPFRTDDWPWPKPPVPAKRRAPRSGSRLNSRGSRSRRISSVDQRRSSHAARWV